MILRGFRNIQKKKKKKDLESYLLLFLLSKIPLPKT